MYDFPLKPYFPYSTIQHDDGHNMDAKTLSNNKLEDMESRKKSALCAVGEKKKHKKLNLKWMGRKSSSIVHKCSSYSIYRLGCVWFISVFVSCAVVCISHPHALMHLAHMSVCSHVCSGMLSYPAVPACWQSGCPSSGSGTSPSRQTWSEAGRGRGAHQEISERKQRNLNSWLLFHVYMSRMFDFLPCHPLSPGRPLCSCVVFSSPWEESSVSLPPLPSPVPGCAPQNKWGHPLCPYLSADNNTINEENKGNLCLSQTLLSLSY